MVFAPEFVSRLLAVYWALNPVYCWTECECRTETISNVPGSPRYVLAIVINYWYIVRDLITSGHASIFDTPEDTPKQKHLWRHPQMNNSKQLYCYHVLTILRMPTLIPIHGVSFQVRLLPVHVINHTHAWRNPWRKLSTMPTFRNFHTFFPHVWFHWQFSWDVQCTKTHYFHSWFMHRCILQIHEYS